ncbi:hypothetical protein BES08_24250 (plasmid) [Novosphingobium resinovorum]|uniref:Uncharacterized protein n=1 Tax=Novosphingobium resinovorum TaxID=158500 RepID=A0A1D8ACP1_9SPHN|nr:hypothetical protein BES08_24250 [Novosphingobium resinovorum]
MFGFDFDIGKNATSIRSDRRSLIALSDTFIDGCNSIRGDFANMAVVSGAKAMLATIGAIAKLT